MRSHHRPSSGVCHGCEALLTSIAFVAASVVVGCADEGAPSSSPRAASAPRSPVAAPSPLAEATRAVVRVGGVVATDLDDPVVGRAVTVVDARGERREAVTGRAGAFAIDGVTAPYDLAVVAEGVSTVFLGLRRTDPWIEVSERRGPAPVMPSQLVRVGVHAGACPPDGSVTAVTTSASGGGSSTASCAAASAGPLVVEVEHAWRTGSVSPEEGIVAHVLASDARGASFAYARAAEILARPGETSASGIVEPIPVEVAGPVPFGARAGALEDWRWTTELLLDVAGTGAGFVLGAARVPDATTHVPIVPGASLRISASASHPRGDARGGFHRSSQAWSGARALSGSAPLLDVEVGPDIVRPEAGAELSIAAGGFSWRSTRAALATLAVADVARGVVRFRVHTNGDDVSMRRLATLGVPTLMPGEHALDLSASAGHGVDDACSPDPAIRRRRFDRARPGGATSLRQSFEVTE